MAEEDSFQMWNKVRRGLDIIQNISTASYIDELHESLDNFGELAELSGIIGGFLSNISPCLPEVKYRQMAADYSRLVQRLKTLSPHHAEMNALIEDDTEYVYAESILLEVSEQLLVMEEERLQEIAKEMAENEASDGDGQGQDMENAKGSLDENGQTVEANGNDSNEGVREDEGRTDGRKDSQNGEEVDGLNDSQVEGRPESNKGGQKESEGEGQKESKPGGQNEANDEGQDEEDDDMKRQENMTTKEKLIDSHIRHRIAGAIYDIMDKLIDCDDEGMLNLIYEGTGGYRLKLMHFMQYLCKLFTSGLIAGCTAEALVKNSRKAAEQMGRSFSDLFQQLQEELQRQILKSTQWEALRANLKVDLERLSNENRGRHHQEVANSIFESVRNKYDWLNFLICVYDDIGGPQNHSFDGHWVHVCHRNNMNVVAAYARKSDQDSEEYVERLQNIDVWLDALNEEINEKTKDRGTESLVSARDAKDTAQEYLDEEGDWRFVLCTRRKKGLHASGDLWDRTVYRCGKRFSFFVILK